MSENRTINIDIKQNADEAVKSFNKLNDSLDNTAKSLDKNATFAQRYGDELQPLTTRLGEAEDRLYELAAAGQQTSKEYQDLLETVANYRKIQIQTDAVVDAASLRLDEKLGGALQGAASGFAGVQGAMALFGNESEELEKTLVKLQGAMALAEGVRGVREGIKSFQALGTTVQGVFKGMTAASKAFAIGGIGLLVTGISYLMGAFDSATESVDSFAKAQNQSNAIQQKAIENAAEELNALDKLQKTINDETISREAKNKAVAELQNKYPDLLKNVNAEKLSTENLNKAIALNIKLAEARARIAAAEALRSEKYQELLREELDLKDKQAQADKINALFRRGLGQDAIAMELGITQASIDRTLREAFFGKKRQERIKAEIAQIDGITKADQKLLEQVENKAKVYEETEKKTEKAVKTTAREVANYSRQLEKERIDAMEDGMEKRIKLLEFELQGELSGIDKNGKKASELRKAIEDRYGKEIQKVKDEYRDRSDRDDEIALEKKVATRLEIGQQEIDAEEYIGNEIYKLKVEQDEKDKERIRQLNEFRVQSIKDGLQTISNLTELFAGKSEKQQRRAFQIQKAVNIANAVVDTYKAANTALASSPPPFNYIAMAATITAGLVNVKKIASQQFQSSSSSSGGGGTPSAPETATASSPQFNTIGSSGINQLAQLQQQPVQAYVVSGEVTSAQALDRNRIQNATL